MRGPVDFEKEYGPKEAMPDEDLLSPEEIASLRTAWYTAAVLRLRSEEEDLAEDLREYEDRVSDLELLGIAAAPMAYLRSWFYGLTEEEPSENDRTR